MHIDLSKPLLGTDRCKVQAYICSEACVKLVHDLGTVQLKQAYRNRPQGCRYVIGSQWDTVGGRYNYLVWDLFKVEVKDSLMNPIIPPPRMVHTDVDTAILATLMLYGKEAPDTANR